MTVTSKFTFGNKVFWIENNRVQSARVKGIHFPYYWRNSNGTIEQTSFTYRLDKDTKLHDNNTGGVAECLLFSSKEELLKSL